MCQQRDSLQIHPESLHKQHRQDSHIPPLALAALTIRAVNCYFIQGSDQILTWGGDLPLYPAYPDHGDVLTLLHVSAVILLSTLSGKVSALPEYYLREKGSNATNILDIFFRFIYFRIFFRLNEGLLKYFLALTT